MPHNPYNNMTDANFFPDPPTGTSQPSQSAPSPSNNMTDSSSLSDPSTGATQPSQSPPSDSGSKREADSPQPESSPCNKRSRVVMLEEVEDIFPLLDEAESKSKTTLKRAQDAIEQVERFLQSIDKNTRECAQIIMALKESEDRKKKLITVSREHLNELADSSFTAVLSVDNLKDRFKEAKEALAEVPW
ncbi:uncharacterized protein BDV14DRAFT_77601 [Aspergillus stella-maris]|uniref:uncharacterized protein n=1 Tax=Aspergillus stella-maris TaxID=1810926 RepID=UPI003CCDCF98